MPVGGAQDQPQDSAPRYAFSWLLEGSALKPRGGTTKGVPVTVDMAESAAWKSLRERDLTTVERDRRAILAMSGSYRVTFDFLLQPGNHDALRGKKLRPRTERLLWLLATTYI